MWNSVFIYNDAAADTDWEIIEHDFGVQTPSTASDQQPDDDDLPSPQQYNRESSDIGSDDEFGQSTETGAPKRKKGGYDSRIEQILYEHPELPILIVDAGKSLESGGKYIVYTIRTGVSFFTSIQSTR